MSRRAAIVQLESEDEVRVLAAANNALSFDDLVLERAASLLSAAPPGRVRTALAFWLLRQSGQRGVPSTSLRSLVAEAGPARPLALRVLAARDEPRMRPFLRGYLEHPDPLLRAHTARGLGESRQPSAIGLLVGRFELETDEDVRHAIVCALSSRRGRAVTRALELAQRLDPSPRVRAAARLALGGMRLGDPPPGAELLWAELRSGGEGAGAGALLNVAPGLAFPVFGDPSGILVVAGVGAQHLGIRLQ
jgi:HEAT repeat protein